MSFKNCIFRFIFVEDQTFHIFRLFACSMSKEMDFINVLNTSITKRSDTGSLIL